jgi:hypothetical protein
MGSSATYPICAACHKPTTGHTMYFGKTPYHPECVTEEIQVEHFLNGRKFEHIPVVTYEPDSIAQIIIYAEKHKEVFGFPPAAVFYTPNILWREYGRWSSRCGYLYEDFQGRRDTYY